MISPTGKNLVRGVDRWGDGKFGAPRGNHVHQGIDFVVEHDQLILFPFEKGHIIRMARPYLGDLRYHGVLMEGIEDSQAYISKLFYFMPWGTSSGMNVVYTQGETIGSSEDLALRYDQDITNHVHMQVARKETPREWFNPISLLDVIGKSNFYEIQDKGVH